MAGFTLWSDAGEEPEGEIGGGAPGSTTAGAGQSLAGDAHRKADPNHLILHPPYKSGLRAGLAVPADAPK